MISAVSQSMPVDIYKNSRNINDMSSSETGQSMSGERRCGLTLAVKQVSSLMSLVLAGWAQLERGFWPDVRGERITMILHQLE